MLLSELFNVLSSISIDAIVVSPSYPSTESFFPKLF